MITLVRTPPHHTLLHYSSASPPSNPKPSVNTSTTTCSSSPPTSFPKKPSISRRLLLSNYSIIISTLAPAPAFFSFPAPSFSSSSTDALAQFSELPDSHGVMALDLRIGTGSTPLHADQVAIHYYGRLAAKQGWRFDSTYDHKDSSGEPIPFTFILGSRKVIAGIEAAVRSMKVGGVRRVIVPPSQGYQNTSQEPLPPNFFDRQRLFTTIFNPTRLANGEGSTLGTLIFDIELVSVKHYN